MFYSNYFFSAVSGILTWLPFRDYVSVAHVPTAAVVPDQQLLLALPVASVWPCSPLYTLSLQCVMTASWQLHSN
jgi:hypothetical protein